MLFQQSKIYRVLSLYELGTNDKSFLLVSKSKYIRIKKTLQTNTTGSSSGKSVSELIIFQSKMIHNYLLIMEY